MTATPSAPAVVRRFVAQIMGMPVTLALRGRHSDGAAAQAAWLDVQSSLHEADRVFSTYRSDSDISRLDSRELTLDQCAPEVADVLALGEQARRESGGAFDIRRLGHDGRITLDPSGVVKGWAVQRAVTCLTDLQDTDYCLSAGGDLVCHVSDPAGPAWQIGIEDPLETTRLVAVVPVRDGAVATSGPAHRGAHIIDPRTGRVPAELASVTVVGSSLAWADIDATAAFVMGAASLDWLTSRGRSGVLVAADGTVTVYPPEQ